MRVLPSRDSEIRGAIVRIAKTNTILKRPVNKLFAVENTDHDTNQTVQAISIFVKENPDRKKGNSTLKYLRTDFWSMMREEHLSALSLAYIHRDIFFDYDKIIDISASIYPTRMLLSNPLSEN